MIFIKYRTNHAWGSTNWEYTYIKKCGTITKSLHDFVLHLHDQYSYSDKYRGCDVKRVKPTKNHLWNLINYYTNKIEEFKLLVNSFECLIHEAKEEPLKICSVCQHQYEIKIQKQFKRTKCKKEHNVIDNEEIKKLQERESFASTCPDWKLKIKS
jgi:hypothetical protein